MAEQSDPDQTKKALVALAVCIVRTLEQRDDTFRPRFVAELDREYHWLRDQETDNTGALEALRWVFEHLKELPPGGGAQH